jgi:hypothetical protein
MKNDTIIGIIVGTMVVSIAGIIIVSAILHSSMEDAARTALARQEPLTTYSMGVQINVSFQRGEYANLAVARSKWMTVNQQDLNKSKMLGDFVGQKSKEFMAGFKDGMKRKSKHGTE